MHKRSRLGPGYGILLSIVISKVTALPPSKLSQTFFGPAPLKYFLSQSHTFWPTHHFYTDFLSPSNPTLPFPSYHFPATHYLLSCPAPTPFPSLPFPLSSQQITPKIMKINTTSIKWLTFTTCFIMSSPSSGLHSLKIPAWFFLCYLPWHNFDNVHICTWQLMYLHT